MEKKITVAVLAATGAVGQRFVSLLEHHPWFEVKVVTASERSAGKRYADAVNWVVPGEIPPHVAELTVQPTDDDPGDVELVFSALPSGVAREVEPQLAARGYKVCSNASAMRMAPDVPLLIPEVNHEHIHLLPAQREERGWEGLIVAAPNCSTTAIILPLKVLDEAFGLEAAHVTTLQAISGAGWPGISSFDILDNVVPYIGSEEDKIETEPLKLLGTLTREGRIEHARATISAQVNRVPVMDGHMATLSLKLGGDPTPEDVRHALADYVAPPEVTALPSTPERSLIVRTEPDRPQPRRDRDAGGGMSISVGRVRACPLLTVRLVALAHNTIRGAAGGAIQNAELLAASGYLGEEARDAALIVR